MNASFYLSAVIAVLATLLTITRANAVHALLYLVVSLLAVAVVFYTLGAPFAAVLEVIIYAGAIIVLFVFVVMMLNLGEVAAGEERQWIAPRAWIGPGILSALLAAALCDLLASGGAQPAGGVVGPREIGAALFGPYVLGVELASMLLLASLVGAYHIGRHLFTHKGA